MRSTNALRCSIRFTKMLTAFLISTAVAARRSLETGSSRVASPPTPTVLKCSTNSNNLNATVQNRDWKSFSVQVKSWSIKDPCSVTVTFRTFDVQPLPDVPQQLLLVIIKPMDLSSINDLMHVKMSSTGKQSPFCITKHCRKVYLWASESAQLVMYLQKREEKKILVAYEAELTVASSMNVCGLSSKNFELKIASGDSMYAFAPDDTFEEIPPNSVKCISGFKYSFTVRSFSSSKLRSVTAVACPVNTSCETLLFNEVSCTAGAKVTVPQNGLTLRYVRQNCSEPIPQAEPTRQRTYSGFIVLVQDSVLAERLLNSTTVNYSTIDGAAATSKVTTRSTSQPVLDSSGLFTQHTGASATPGSISADTISSMVVAAALARSSPQLLSSSSSLMFHWSTSSSALTARDGHFSTIDVPDAIAAWSSAPNVTVNSGPTAPDSTDPFDATVVVVTFSVIAAGVLAICITVATLCRRRKLLAQTARLNATDDVRHSGQAHDMEIIMVDNNLYGETR